MSTPLVIGYHLIWTGYAHWLPNDPRGSGSTEMFSQDLAKLGPIHFGRKKKQPSRAEIEEFYAEADNRLKYRRLTFDDSQIAAIGQAFAETVTECRYTCYACAILRNHVHVLIRKHRHLGEEMITMLQDRSATALRRLDPSLTEHPIWTFQGWFPFLFDIDEMWRVIKYIQGNPRKEGLPDQHWPFVKPYDDWPLFPGHDPNSPFARGIREYRQKKK